MFTELERSCGDFGLRQKSRGMGGDQKQNKTVMIMLDFSYVKFSSLNDVQIFSNKCSPESQHFFLFSRSIFVFRQVSI
jgi:hypothetical protein